MEACSHQNTQCYDVPHWPSGAQSQNWHLNASSQPQTSRLPPTRVWLRGALVWNISNSELDLRSWIWDPGSGILDLVLQTTVSGPWFWSRFCSEQVQLQSTISRFSPQWWNIPEYFPPSFCPSSSSLIPWTFPHRLWLRKTRLLKKVQIPKRSLSASVSSNKRFSFRTNISVKALIKSQIRKTAQVGSCLSYCNDNSQL